MTKKQTKNPAAVALGKLRGQTVTSEQARAAINARWSDDAKRAAGLEKLEKARENGPKPGSAAAKRRAKKAAETRRINAAKRKSEDFSTSQVIVN